MEYAVGIDVIEIARVRKVLERHPERFLSRVYSPEEVAFCRGRVPELAARFAAKEAVMKALGTGARGLAWREIEVLPNQRGKPLVYLHGNAENISTHFHNVAWMPAAGFNVLALDYRGYGGSEGTPTLEGVQLDIDAAMRTLLARRDVDPQRIIVFGQSLGGALAIHYVAHSDYRANVRAIVVDSAFSDYRRIVRDKAASFFLTWPFQWLLPQTVDNNFSPAASVHDVAPIPLLFIHGERDAIVPLEHSKRLFERAAEPKELWIVPEAGHIQAVRKKDVRKRLTEFLRRHSGPEAGLALR